MASDFEPEAEARLLELLQELLELPALDLSQALMAASGSVASWLRCDKADTFLFDPKRQLLLAVGTSDTPLGRLQKSLGLDILPLANGGRVAEVFQTGRSYTSGRVDEDPHELRGIVNDLAVRSQIGVALEINGIRRGVLAVVSQQHDRFGLKEQKVLELVAHWIGALAHRAELVEQLRSDEAERARRVAADEIVTVLAHDVRNFLTPLSSRLQSMKLKLARGRELSASDLDVPLAAVRRLARLTQDLLDVARLDQGLFELTLGPVDLGLLVRDISTSLSGGRSEIQVTTPEQVIIIADADRLRQAIENVLSNALKHSPPTEPVRVLVEQRGQPGCVEVEVSDSGPGIAPELLPRLFERFVAAPGSRGLGLGLYVAKCIASAHGGQLSVESTLGAGAQFRFTLPIEGVPERA